jgi:riboflavin synthase
MFTGLIEAVGEVASIDSTIGGWRLRIATPLAAQLSEGDSIAVNGACLTAIAPSQEQFEADVSPETRRVTTIGQWVPGRRVNLERPLRADARLGGHFVLGHVDAMAALLSARADADCYWLEFDVPDTMQALLIPKGSVTIDGISLTVAALDGRSFAVQIVPHTWAHTALSELTPGAAVNIEADVLGKYVARLLAVEGRHQVAAPGRIV